MLHFPPSSWAKLISEDSFFDLEAAFLDISPAECEPLPGSQGTNNERPCDQPIAPIQDRQQFLNFLGG